jgi:alcohol dehydrogenase class IV
MEPLSLYHSSVSIAFGDGVSSAFVEELSGLFHGKKVCLISDPGVVQTGITGRITEALERKGYRVALFSAVQRDPTFEAIDAAVDFVRSSSPSAVIGLGGGSALDTAKLAAVAAAGERSTHEYALMACPLPERTATLIAIPTTAGTGSEVTRTVVFSHVDHHKVWAWGEPLRPDFVVLDPELTVSLPSSLTAFTGLDALVHAIEASTNRETHPFAQANGLRAITLVAQNLKRALMTPDDLESRKNLMIASTLAGMAIDAVGTGIAHGIGHALSTLTPLHHGRSVAVALDAVYPRNAEANIPVHAEIALALGVSRVDDPPDLLAQRGARAFHDLILETGIETSLRKDGLSAQDLDRLVDVILSPENRILCDKNCYTPTEKELRELAQQLLGS